MTIRLTEEYMQLRRRYHDFAEREVVPDRRELAPQSFIDLRLLPRMAAAGLLGISVPAEHGGAGEDLLALALAGEALESVDSGARTLLTYHTAMYASALRRWGSPVGRERLLPSAASGERIGTVVLDVPESGHPRPPLFFRATRLSPAPAESLMLEGSHPSVALAAIADVFIVFAETVDGELSAYLVDRNQAGVVAPSGSGDIVPLWGSLRLEEVVVGDEARLGGSGDGERIWQELGAIGGLTVAAGAVGLIERSIGRAVQCLDAGVTPPTKGQQLMKGKLANMFRRVGLARHMVLGAAAALATGVDSYEQVASASWFAVSAARDSLADARHILDAGETEGICEPAA